MKIYNTLFRATMTTFDCSKWRSRVMLHTYNENKLCLTATQNKGNALQLECNQKQYAPELL